MAQMGNGITAIADLCGHGVIGRSDRPVYRGSAPPCSNWGPGNGDTLGGAPVSHPVMDMHASRAAHHPDRVAKRAGVTENGFMDATGPEGGERESVLQGL